MQFSGVKYFHIVPLPPPSISTTLHLQDFAILPDWNLFSTLPIKQKLPFPLPLSPCNFCELAYFIYLL